MKSRYHKASLTILLATVILAAPAAFGNPIRFDFSPAGTPLVTALLEDVGPDQVQLTINALALPGNNSIGSICFNFNPAFDSRNLIFTQTASLGGVQGFANTGNDSYKVGGGSGKFDINLIFGPSHPFITGDTVTYSLSGISGLSVSDFLYLESPSAGRTPRYAAGTLQELNGVVVVQGTPQDVPGAAPDTASTLGLLVTSLLALGWVARRPGVISSPRH